MLSEAEARAWDAYVRMSRIVAEQVSRDLARQTDLSAADHDVLCALADEALADVPDRSLRLGTLAETMQWELSRLSHQLSRMERRGLVERHACVDDGRGVAYALSAEGRRVIRRAGPIHDEAVRRHMLTALSPAELEQLAALSAKVVSTHREG